MEYNTIQSSSFMFNPLILAPCQNITIHYHPTYISLIQSIVLVHGISQYIHIYIHIFTVH